MVSTVTTSTVTTIAAMGFAASLGVFAVALLISYLTGKELLSASSGTRQKVLARSLNIAIVPLVMTFAVIIALKIAEILG